MTIGQWQVDPKKLSFYITLCLAFAALLTIIYQTGSFCVNQMHGSADRRFEERLTPSLTPPDGKIFVAIEHAVQAHQVQTEEEFHSQIDDLSKEMSQMNLRMQRQEILMDGMYREITGRQPPPIPGE